MIRGIERWQAGPDGIVQADAGSPASKAIDVVFSRLKISQRDIEESIRPIHIDAQPTSHSGWSVLSNGQPIVSCTKKEELPPLIEGLFTHYAARTCMSCSVFHASMILMDGAGVLMPGENRSGKSTLALWLARQGARYLGDDLTFIDTSSSEIMPFPKAVTLKHGSWHLVPDNATYEDPIRGAIRYETPKTALVRSTFTKDIRLIVFPEYRPGFDADTQAVDPEIVALALIQQSVGGLERQGGTMDLIAQLSALPAYLIRYPDSERAEQRIRALLANEGSV